MTRESMFRNFCMYFPSEVNNVKHYRVDPMIPNELILQCQDGSVYIYNDYKNTIRKIIQNSDELTEEERRSEFGRKLRYLISKNGYTQAEFADLVGISQPILNGYITGRNTPSFTVVCRLSDILGCSTDDLRYK